MLKSLSIRNVRNIQSLDCQLSPEINFFYGENGSGKSSILEAIHYLSLGRSFRSRLVGRVITHGKDSLIVSADSLYGRIGIEKTKQGQTTIRMNNETLNSIAELAAIIPIQLIDPHSYRILEGTSKQRRQLLDWGVFHVEHQFLQYWRETQRAIKHRNAAIRRGLSQQQITSWNPEIIRLSHKLTDMREAYLQHYTEKLTSTLGLISNLNIEMSFYPGWNRDKGLEAVLHDSLPRDIQLGYTQFGPHRADLKFKTEHANAIDVLSRGQQKLLIIATCLTQGLCLYEMTNKQCIYLIDDIAAELDVKLSEVVLSFLSKIESQIMITSVNPELEQNINKSSAKLFNIESGSLLEMA